MGTPRPRQILPHQIAELVELNIVHEFLRDKQDTALCKCGSAKNRVHGRQAEPSPWTGTKLNPIIAMRMVKMIAEKTELEFEIVVWQGAKCGAQYKRKHFKIILLVWP